MAARSMVPYIPAYPMAPSMARKSSHPHCIFDDTCTTPRSRDEVEILRQRPSDRHLEEARGLWVDDVFAIGGKKDRDLLLSAKGDLNHRRIEDHHLETMRILRPRGVLSKRQIVPVVCGAIGQVSRA